MKVDTDMKFSKEVNGNERGFSTIELIMVSNNAGNEIFCKTTYSGNKLITNGQVKCGLSFVKSKWRE